MRQPSRSGRSVRCVLQDCAQCLTEKMAAFLFTVSTIYDAEWIMKVDDDVYLSPVRVLPVLRQWDRIGADHVGCFRHGSVPAAGEPAGFLLGSRYPLHPYSALFAVRGPVVRDVLRPNSLMFRHFSSQGVLLLRSAACTLAPACMSWQRLPLGHA